jgi:hypothetical protein
MSHFGRVPITTAWYRVVFPALLLTYFGQGAVVLTDPKAAANPLYALTGGWALLRRSCCDRGDRDRLAGVDLPGSRWSSKGSH